MRRHRRSEALFDPWRVLGVRDDATPSEIRRAFRRAALRHHPDRNPGDPHAAARFRDARSAFETLVRMAESRIADGPRSAKGRAEPRAPRRADRPMRVRCLVVGKDIVGVLPEACREPGRWVVVELLAARTCPRCLGEGGELIAKAWIFTERVECPTCDGVGLVKVEHRLRVRVPHLPARALRLRGRGVIVADHRGDAILQLA